MFKFLNFYLLLVLTTCFACKSDIEIDFEDCEIVMTQDEIFDITADATANKFDSKSDIVDNLIGQWALIGVIPGWIAYEPTKQCIVLDITADEIKLNDLRQINQSKSTSWELIEFEVNSFKGFYLETNEETFTNRIGMSIFSADIMFGSGRVDDANTFVYEKIN